MSGAYDPYCRRTMLAEMRGGFIMRSPRAFMCITGVDVGGPIVATEPDVVEVLVGGRVLRIPRRALSARDRFGSPMRLVRLIDPRPGYTRHTLGDRELERDIRRRRRGIRR